MAKLIGNVFVDNAWFGPAHGNADDVPAEVARQIVNPKAWDGGEVPTAETADGDEPPRSGKGSGTDTWRAYAAGLGIEVTADDNRDDIVALVDAHRANQS